MRDGDEYKKIKLFKKNRKNPKLIYELWKALDFERQIKILKKSGNSLLFKILRFT